MKQILSSFALLSLLVALSLASCTKDDDSNPTQPVTNHFTLNQMHKDLKSSPQTLTVTAGTHQIIYGTKKTKLTFYPNSFKDKNGNTISSGAITLKLIEIYKAGDMISNRAMTTSNGSLLRSGGEVYLKAYKNGEEVYPNKYGIGFNQPGMSTQPMQLYYGNNNNADSVVEWTKASGTVGTSANNTISLDSIPGNTGIYYQFDSCTNFNWINCDYFYGSSAQLTNVSIIVPDTSFNSNNTMIFVVFPTINSATFANVYNWGTHAFSLSSGYLVPIGMNIHIASVTNKNGSYYYAELLNQTITNNMSVSITPQPQTLAYIQNKLSQL